MNRVESFLKKSRFTPLQIVGEIFFGCKGEFWEKNQREGEFEWFQKKY